MNPPRVLHLIHHLRIGGAEMLLAELLPHLARAGFEVHVCCLVDRGPLFEVLRERGIPGHFIDRHRGLDLAAVWRLRTLLLDLRINILNTHAYSAGFWGRLAAATAHTPNVVTTVHSVAGWCQPVKQRIGNRLLRPWTDRIVAVSESVRRSMFERGTPPELIQVIHNGICVERFRRKENPACERRRLGLPSGVTLIGMIARCSPEKGGDIWLQAIAQLARTGLDVQGVLVGDGPALAGWKEVAVREGIANRIRFVGMQIDIVPWLTVLDVLICPSKQESFGIIALEAQAVGVPVVATRVDGFCDVLHDEKDALLLEVNDYAGMAEAVRLLIRSPDIAKCLVAAGHLNAARFRIERTAELYSNLYRELLAAGHET